MLLNTPCIRLAPNKLKRGREGVWVFRGQVLGIGENYRCQWFT